MREWQDGVVSVLFLLCKDVKCFPSTIVQHFLHLSKLVFNFQHYELEIVPKVEPMQ